MHKNTNIIRMKEQAYEEEIVELNCWGSNGGPKAFERIWNRNWYVQLNSKNTSRITHKTHGTRTLRSESDLNLADIKLFGFYCGRQI